jgi:hypothetical protein
MESIVPYGVRAPQKQNKNTGLMAGIAIFIVIIVAACVTVGLMFSNPYAGRNLENIEPSDTLASTAAASVLTGKENTFSSDEVNAYLAYLMKKHADQMQTGNLQIQAVAVADGSGNSADVYIPVVYQGKNLAVTLNVTPSLDTQEQKLRFEVNSAKIGRLAVPVNWLLDKAEDHLPKNFQRDGNRFWCKAPSFEASLLGITASAGLTKLEMNDGQLKLAAKVQITLG